jgi:hypothetical protein
MDRNLDHEVNLASSKAAEAGWSPAATEGAEEALGAPVVEQCYQCGSECRRVGETSRQLVVGGGDPRVLNGKRRANADLGSTGLWRRGARPKDKLRQPQTRARARIGPFGSRNS